MQPTPPSIPQPTLGLTAWHVLTGTGFTLYYVIYTIYLCLLCRAYVRIQSTHIHTSTRKENQVNAFLSASSNYLKANVAALHLKKKCLRFVPLLIFTCNMSVQGCEAVYVKSAVLYRRNTQTYSVEKRPKSEVSAPELTMSQSISLSKTNFFSMSHIQMSDTNFGMARQLT